MGNAGSVITAEAGSVIVNVYVAQYPAIDTESRNRTVHLLLRKCELAGIKPMIERISFELYRSRYFKSLTACQLATLHAITDEICEVLYASRGRFAVPARRVSTSPAL